MRGTGEGTGGETGWGTGGEQVRGTGERDSWEGQVRGQVGETD